LTTKHIVSIEHSPHANDVMDVAYSQDADEPAEIWRVKKES
jgi:hypothetical protein